LDGEPVREVLRNGAIRRIEVAWTAGTTADGAFLVVLLIAAVSGPAAAAAAEPMTAERLAHAEDQMSASA
jgi:hypothetical protein